MVLQLNRETVNALRDLAAALPVALEKIANDTMDMVDVLHAAEERIGPHKEDIMHMLENIKEMLENNADNYNTIVKSLNAAADLLEEILNESIDSDGAPSIGQKQLKLR